MLNLDMIKDEFFKYVENASSFVLVGEYNTDDEKEAFVILSNIYEVSKFVMQLEASEEAERMRKTGKHEENVWMKTGGVTIE